MAKATTNRASQAIVGDYGARWYWHSPQVVYESRAHPPHRSSSGQNSGVWYDWAMSKYVVNGLSPGDTAVAPAQALCSVALPGGAGGDGHSAVARSPKGPKKAINLSPGGGPCVWVWVGLACLWCTAGWCLGQGRGPPGCPCLVCSLLCGPPRRGRWWGVCPSPPAGPWPTQWHKSH